MEDYLASEVPPLPNFISVIGEVAGLSYEEINKVWDHSFRISLLTKSNPCDIAGGVILTVESVRMRKNNEITRTNKR